MDQPTHVIDPDGEVIIILLNADAPFAEPGEDMIAHGFPHTLPEPNNNIQNPAEEIKYPEGYIKVPKPTLRAKQKKKKRYNTVRASLELSPPPDEEPAVEAPGESGVACEQPDESCFRIQVSAKHLILASPVFKKILAGGWKESITYLQKGSVEVTAESWDIEALLILLRLILCQHYRIPRKLTLGAPYMIELHSKPHPRLPLRSVSRSS